MFCSKCGAKNDDSSRFCYSCGNTLDISAVESPVNPETNDKKAVSENTYWENQNQYNPAAQTQFPNQQQASNQQAFNQSQQNPYQQTFNQNQQNPYQQPVYPNQQYQYYGQQMPLQFNNNPRKKVKPVFIITPIVAVIAVIIIVAVIASQSNKGVLDNILGAAKGTLNAGSFEFEMDAAYTDEYGTENNSADGIFEYDLNKEKLNFDVDADGYRSILYDGVAYECEDGEIDYSEDISSELSKIFDSYSDYKVGLDSLAKIDWEQAADDAGIPVSLDNEELNKCITQFEKNMNNTKYLKSVCNKFEKKNTSGGTVYTFDVDVPEFVKSVMDTFQPVLDEFNIDSQTDYISESLDSVKECVLEITIKSGKLTAVSADISIDDGYSPETMELDLKMDKYGKAALDKDEIEDLIDNYDANGDW